MVVVQEAPKLDKININPTILLSNGRFLQSEYYNRIVQPLLGTPLFNLHEELMEPFKKEEESIFDIDTVDISIAQPQSPERNMAGIVVNYGYNARYRRNHGSIIDVAYDRYDAEDTTHTLVATSSAGSENVVLGTFRILEGAELEIYDFFEILESRLWPHLREDGETLVPGELGRFSLHPFIDILRYSTNQDEARFAIIFKRQVLRKLWLYGMTHMSEMGVQMPYFTLAPEVHKFVASAGIIPKQVLDATPSNTELSIQIRNFFKEYWRPGRRLEEQPALYIAPWSLAPMEQVVL